MSSNRPVRKVTPKKKVTSVSEVNEDEADDLVKKMFELNAAVAPGAGVAANSAVTDVAPPTAQAVDTPPIAEATGVADTDEVGQDHAPREASAPEQPVVTTPRTTAGEPVPQKASDTAPHPATGQVAAPPQLPQAPAGAIELRTNGAPAHLPPPAQQHSPFGNTFPGHPQQGQQGGWQQPPGGFGPFGHVPQVQQYQAETATRATIGFSTTRDISEFWKHWLKANTGAYRLPDGVIPPIIVDWIISNRHEILRAAVLQYHGHDIGPEQREAGSGTH